MRPRGPGWLGLTDADIGGLGEGEVVQRDGLASVSQLRAWCDFVQLQEDGSPLRAAGMGQARSQAQALRGDRTRFVEADMAPIQGLWRLFDAVRLELNQEAWLGLGVFTIQLAVYDGQGEVYVAHRDATRGDGARRATGILYLNPDWVPAHGGCLRIHPPSGSRDIEPIAGRLVLFRSDRLLHEVLPCWHRRLAATAWYRGRGSDPTRNAAQD